MNRKQRRSLQKRKRIQITNKMDVDNKSVNLAYDTFLLIALTVLHDKYGFGKTRLNEFLKHFNSGVETISGGFASVIDLNETLFKETGVIVFDRDQYKKPVDKK